jgi:hypothetical protein
LALLSVLTSCEYRGIPPLRFLLSGSTEISVKAIRLESRKHLLKSYSSQRQVPDGSRPV